MHRHNNGKNDSFYADSLVLCGMAMEMSNPDSLVIIGGNPEGSDERQMEIFSLINTLHKQGQHSYWYKAERNAALDIPDQVVPGQSYVVVDLDDMTFEKKIEQGMEDLGRKVVGSIKEALSSGMSSNKSAD